jgi:hypothetical protein
MLNRTSKYGTKYTCPAPTIRWLERRNDPPYRVFEFKYPNAGMRTVNDWSTI